MTPNKDTPAFPTITWDQMADGQFVQKTEHSGLTKREKIAAMALQGLLANPENKGSDAIVNCVFDAVTAADYLLTELSKP